MHCSSGGGSLLAKTLAVSAAASARPIGAPDPAPATSLCRRKSGKRTFGAGQGVELARRCCTTTCRQRHVPRADVVSANENFGLRPRADHCICTQLGLGGAPKCTQSTHYSRPTPALLATHSLSGQHHVTRSCILREPFQGHKR